MKRAIVFPGQGSQVVGMGMDFAEAIPECSALFDRANEILGYDIRKICFEGPQEELNKSNHAQMGLFVAGVAAWKALRLREPDMEYHALAGHSLGEWTALHVAGAIGFDDTIRVLRARGEYMQAACEEHPGAMLAVMGLEADVLVRIAEEAGCYVANFNSLAQTVLSGTESSIDRAEGLAQDAGAKRAVRLPVAGAFHSPLMKPAADRMALFLKEVELRRPGTEVWSNVTAKPHAMDDLRNQMVQQITSSVQWVGTIQGLCAAGVEEIVECGPGKVLTGLIKRIDKQCAVRNIGALTDLERG